MAFNIAQTLHIPSKKKYIITGKQRTIKLLPGYCIIPYNTFHGFIVLQNGHTSYKAKDLQLHKASTFLLNTLRNLCTYMFIFK